MDRFRSTSGRPDCCSVERAAASLRTQDRVDENPTICPQRLRRSITKKQPPTAARARTVRSSRRRRKASPETPPATATSAGCPSSASVLRQNRRRARHRCELRRLQPTAATRPSVRNVNEVPVVFTVTDKHNHYVRDLSKKDFKVMDDGRPVDDIRSFRRETDLPLRVGLADRFQRLSPRPLQVRAGSRD